MEFEGEIEVHKDLYELLKKQFLGIVAALRNVNFRGRKLCVGGHSVGGGTAILFAFEMIRREWPFVKANGFDKNLLEIITFGAPTVLAFNDGKRRKNSNKDIDQR